MADHLLVGAVKNGEYTKTQASLETTKANETTSTSKTEAKRDTGYNKDMFLQLLVAEMQYQDPLEPSDNSQYVAQLASFTQIEAMQTVQDQMETIQSNSIVGKVVALNVNGQEVTGRVDFTTKDDKKGLMLSIDGELYEMSKMISVIDEDYYNAKYLSNLFTEAVKKLPDPKQVTVKDESAIKEAAEILSTMNAYDQSFVSEDVMKKYQSVFNQYAKLIEAINQAAKELEKVPEEEKTAEVEASTENTSQEAEKTTEQTAEETTNAAASSGATASENTEGEAAETESTDDALETAPVQEV